MGIPKFYQTLIRRYPLIESNIKNNSEVPPIDNLYLDINSILHHLSHSREHNLLALTQKKDELTIYHQTCEVINQIVNLIKPKYFLMIVMDGVCPIGKISNQIISRYISNLYKSDEIDHFLEGINLKNINDFDGNKIFPGTDFMKKFEEYLNNYVIRKTTDKNSKNLWKEIKVLISGTNSPGEGEYKIMEQIRESKEKERDENIKKYCIFSGDADVLLLSLLII
jgi:5'-3' exoribonuclease 1